MADEVAERRSSGSEKRRERGEDAAAVQPRFGTPALWLRRAVFWAGAVIVAVVAIGFASAADWVSTQFETHIAERPLLALFIVPAGFAAAVLVTRTLVPGARGSGIPQVIAALHMRDERKIDAMLSLRIALGKVLLTLAGLGCGASIGREGPTVQVGASIMHTLGEWLKLPRRDLKRGLVMAGGAAGIAAAFNTPLAGIVFAIEELSHSFEARASGTVFTAVIIAGATTLALSGNYAYFGHTTATLGLQGGWSIVLTCSVVGGICGGLFASLLIRAAIGFPGALGRAIKAHPVLVAAICGLAVALLGIVSGGETYGTGYVQARHAVEGATDIGVAYPLLKMVANAFSYLSGIPGGIFAPALAVGATIGSVLSQYIAAPDGALVLLAMAGYFSASCRRRSPRR